VNAGLQDAWSRRGPLACSLRPLSWVFGSLAGLRRAAFRAGWLRAHRLPVPVLVVGNVVAGGGGKTPVVAALVEHLQRAGLQPGVISRGWGRRGTGVREVHPHDDAAEVGDEPLLLAQRCKAPVFVGAKRVHAGRALLAQHPRTGILVSDDGLQHLSLARDLELCVFDARGLGNGWLLPAGPLREPWPRAADFVLRPPGGTPAEGFDMSRRLSTHARRADGSTRPLADLAAETPLVALAGIANPPSFFAMLRAAGLPLAQTLALPDHHAFEGGPPPLPAGACVLCTEKDAVKLWRTHPLAWAVPLELHIEDAFWDALDRRLRARLSSSDGFETA
jgi:tetraacyldisaccharide 4'-kinase